MSLVALAIGFLAVVLVAVAHNYALIATSRLTPRRGARPHLKIHATFFALLTLHFAEIMAFSALNGALLRWESFAGSDPAGLTWADTIYLTGVNFTTLGYTEIDLSGEIRLVTMMQALGGFMVLTWSATYLYSVCERSWNEAVED